MHFTQVYFGHSGIRGSGNNLALSFAPTCAGIAFRSSATSANHCDSARRSAPCTPWSSAT